MAREEKPKNTNSRTSPLSAANKKERQHDLKHRIQKTTSERDGQRNDVETKKRRLEGIDASKPELKAEYEQLQGEVVELEGGLMEYETQLEELQREKKEVDDMDVDHNEGAQGEASGGGGGGGEDSGGPHLFVTEPNGGSTSLNIDDDSDDEGLFTLAQGMKELGLNQNGKIVAWRQQDRSQPVIVMYSP
jgi:hypothetical protein